MTRDGAGRPDAVPVRDAATVILIRQGQSGRSVLMGRRGQGAAFMPRKVVFPGGAVEAADLALATRLGLAPPDPRLALETSPAVAAALALTAIRELWEETGLALATGRATGTSGAGAGWEGFFARFGMPAIGALRFVFRAVTPPGRPRRFDARFFVADAAAVLGDPLDLSAGDGELADLSWVPLSGTGGLNLPFITRVVLAELAADAGVARGVPFFQHDHTGSRFSLLGGDA